MEKNIHSFTDLTPPQRNVRYTVFCRLLRIWTVVKYNEPSSKQLIFIDEEGRKIQGWINKSWMNKFDHLVEDRIYSISSFGFNPNTPNAYTYSRLSHKLMFFMNTKVEEFEGLSIPHNYFDFVDIETINRTSLDYNYLVDVIGHMVAIGDLVQTEVNGEKNNLKSRIDIKLENFRGDQIRCTLWDHYADQFKKYVKASSNDFIVVIIQYAKISKFQEFISRASLIIWDEAPMTNRFAFEAIDRTLRDILRHSNPNSLLQPFGGKVVVFGGDFRQILPVIPGGSRQDVVSTTINSSHLWNNCKVLNLTRNMRLERGCTESQIVEAREFSEWILRVGDGTEGGQNDGEAIIGFPADVLITEINKPIPSIVAALYPSLLDIQNPADYFQERAILAPTHEIVGTVNDYMLSHLPGEEMVYLSSDSICKSDENYHHDSTMYSAEYLNNIRCSGVPNHVLKLKIGVPVMLLRNIDQSSGLCNGTRLIVTRLGTHVIQAAIISGSNIGHTVYIPRILISPSDTRYPFKFQRRQFPLIVCFAMTINKSQGQSLSRVGLFLPKPVFSHGQLYVALSGVTSKEGLKVLICDRKGQPQTTTLNVVYKEVFQNLI